MPTLELHAQRYLNAERFKIEFWLAMFGVWWGGVVLWTITQGDDPLRWFPGTRHLHMQMSAFLLALSILHGMAVRGNGRWGIISPAVRLFCFIGFALFFGTLAWHSTTTGFATYTAISATFASAARGAHGDLKLAWKGFRYA